MTLKILPKIWGVFLPLAVFLLFSCDTTLGTAAGVAEPELFSELDRWGHSAQDPSWVRLVSLLEKSIRSYESLRGYQAVFHKQEKSADQLEPPEQIFLRFEKPFKVYMKWLDSHKQGLQVVYERGAHNGKLAIHKPGLFSRMMPVLFLDPKSPWVRQGSASYNIEDVGIGTFLYDFTRAVLQSAAGNGLRASFPQVLDRDGGQAVDVTFAGSTEDSVYFAYRILVFFDGQTLLPVRMELFDWQGHPMGIYSYEGLKLDVGSEDKEFVGQIHRQLYKIYTHQG